MPTFSIVTPVYNTAAFVEPFYRRTAAAAGKLTDDFEIIFVNDASPDDSQAHILALKEKDPRVGLIELARNFGQHKAIFTGIEAARGDHIFVLDADLEESPEWLTLYFDALQNAQADVVYGYQKTRKGGLLEKLTGALSFAVINRVFKLPYRRNVVTATLMTRRFADHLLGFQEEKAIFSISCYLTGHRSAALEVEKKHRGESGYSLRRRVAHFMDYMVAVTDKPLLWPAWIGGAMLAAGACSILALFLGDPPHFYAKMVMAVTLTVGGAIMAALGVMGLYLAHLLANARGRPRVIVKAFYAPGPRA